MSKAAFIGKGEVVMLILDDCVEESYDRFRSDGEKYRRQIQRRTFCGALIPVSDRGVQEELDLTSDLFTAEFLFAKLAREVKGENFRIVHDKSC